MKYLNFLSSLFFATAVLGGFASCNDSDVSDDDFQRREEALAPVVNQYVNNTVIITYKSLADASIDLYNALSALKASKTEANLKSATDAWIESRKWWELSEAFLFGAATNFGIDPHIDTWPLDEETFKKTIKNADFLASMDADDDGIWASEHLGVALLGFHGIEFILYREGSPKNVSEITSDELIYAVSVAGDLRNQCIRLEAAWAGVENISAEKRTLVEELDLQVKPSDSRFYYGENMLNAGAAGSSYISMADAAGAILEGCMDISAEVGETKIGTPHSKDDVNYIESPYSFNSKTDFADNIRSIANAYLGGIEGKRGHSVSEYIKTVDSQLDGKIQAAITNAINKIDAIPYPFARNYASTEAAAAMDACDELTSLLTEAKKLVSE
ncbi:MAG: peptidase M75 [Dysgonamonadaceae bacterium]|jgi:hypothetical protein|nr:peptidase M75 [Dysgonamonadaceae bacterium]